jgi:hypothetical protein
MFMDRLTLVVMAAGMGSRYGGLKQIDPMGPNGETLVEYSVYDAIRAGFEKVVFIIRREFADAFKGQIGDRFRGRIEVAYVYQELDDLPPPFSVPEGRVKPWGTGQAILVCKEEVDGPFMIQNADDYYGAEAYRVMADGLKQLPLDRFEGCMVGFDTVKTLSLNGAVTRGVCFAEGGYLTRVEERQEVELNREGILQFRQGDQTVAMAGDEICSLNLWGFSPSFFPELERRFVTFLEEQGSELKSEWLLPLIVDELIQEGKLKVKVLNSPDSWYGVTYPEDKPTVVAKLRELHDAGLYPQPLWP